MPAIPLTGLGVGRWLKNFAFRTAIEPPLRARRPRGAHDRHAHRELPGYHDGVNGPGEGVEA